MSKKHILAIATTAFLSGCSSINLDTVVGVSVHEAVPFEGAGERHFTFSKEGRLDKNSIQNALSMSFEEASEISKKKGGLGILVSRYKYGFIVTHYDDNQSMLDRKSALYKELIEEDDKNYNVTITCPSEYGDIATNRGRFGGSTEEIPGPKAIHNFNTICKNSTPHIYRSIWIKGEIDSKYKSEDVFANFTRMLSKTDRIDNVKGFDIEKAKVFKLPMNNNKKTNLALSVFPYRGGAKVVYAFKYNYVYDGKGFTSYSESEINKLKQNVTDITNN